MKNHFSYFWPVKGKAVLSLSVSDLIELFTVLLYNLVLIQCWHWGDGLQWRGWLRHKNPMSFQSPLLAEEQLWALLSERLIRVFSLGCCTHEMCPVQQGMWWPHSMAITSPKLLSLASSYECTLPVSPWAGWAAVSEFVLQSLGPVADPITDSLGCPCWSCTTHHVCQALLRKCGNVLSLAANQSPLWSFQCLKDVVIKETC